MSVSSSVNGISMNLWVTLEVWMMHAIYLMKCLGEFKASGWSGAVKFDGDDDVNFEIGHNANDDMVISAYDYI